MDNEEVELGHTGIRTTRLGLGLASIGGLFHPVSHQNAVETVEAAWSSGVRLFDTAPVYGYGRSERLAGVVLAEKPRSDYVLCTKVGRVIEHGGSDGQAIWADPPERLGPRSDYSYAGVFRSFEDSVTRLGIADVDILHIHDPEQDFGAALTDAYRAAGELRRQGRVRAISIGVNHVDVALAFLRDVADPGLDCLLLAGRYTLFDQEALTELLPLCTRLGVAVIAAGVFHGGALTGESTTAPAVDGFGDRVAHAQAICRSHDVPLLAAALQLPLAHPAIPCVLVGARSAAEVMASTELLAHPIPPQCWNDLRAAGILSDNTPTPSGGD